MILPFVYISIQTFTGTWTFLSFPYFECQNIIEILRLFLFMLIYYYEIVNQSHCASFVASDVCFEPTMRLPEKLLYIHRPSPSLIPQNILLQNVSLYILFCSRKQKYTRNNLDYTIRTRRYIYIHKLHTRSEQQHLLRAWPRRCVPGMPALHEGLQDA